LFEIKTQKVGQELTKQAKKSKPWLCNNMPNKNITIDTGTEATPQQKEIAAHFLTNFFALCWVKESIGDVCIFYSYKKIIDLQINLC